MIMTKRQSCLIVFLILEGDIMRKIKLFIELIVLGALMFTLTGCFILEKDYTLTATEITFEVGTEIPVYTMTASAEGTVDYDCDIVDDNVNYDIVGDYQAECLFVGTETHIIDVHIVDTTKPVILQDDILLVGMGHPEYSELVEHFTVTDNYDDEIVIDIIFPVEQLEDPGDYELEIVATDKSGNEAKLKFQYQLFSYQLPTVSTGIIPDGSFDFIPAYAIDNFELDDELTFEKVEVEIIYLGEIVDKFEKSDLSYHHIFEGDFSNAEYTVNYLFYFKVNKTGLYELVNAQEKITTLENEIPSVALTNILIEKEEIRIHYYVTDISNTFQKFIIYFKKDSGVVIEGFELPFLEGGIHHILESDSNYEIEIEVYYDLLDGKGDSVSKSVVDTVTIDPLFIDNVNSQDTGDEHAVEISIDNPDEFWIEKLIINSEEIIFSDIDNTLYFIVPESSMEFGENIFTIDEIHYIKDGVTEIVTLNKEFSIVRAPDLVLNNVTFNNDSEIVSYSDLFNIVIDFDNIEYFDIQSITVDEWIYNKDWFTIEDGNIVFPYVVRSEIGKIDLEVVRITYLDSEEELQVMQINESATMYVKSYSESIQIITTTSEFLSMTTNGVYRLGADISLSGQNHESHMLDFSGYLDGNGYSIMNMSIEPSSAATTYFGLFGSINSKTFIKDLSIVNSNITILPTFTSTIEVSVGLLAGYDLGAYVSNVDVVNSSISIKDNYAKVIAGGLIGKSTNGNIESSQVEVDIVLDVLDDSRVGGLVGYLYTDGKVLNSSTSGQIIVDGYGERLFAGGLFGSNGSNSYIRSSFSTMDIYSEGGNGLKAYMGGISGVTDGSYFEAIYYSGELENSSEAFELYIGGLYGQSLQTTIKESYAISSINFGVNPKKLYTGNLLGYSHNNDVVNSISETTYTGTTDNASNIIYIGDLVGTELTPSTFAEVFNFQFDTSQIIGVEFNINTSYSFSVDESGTTREAISNLLFVNEEWDFTNLSIDGYPTLISNGN